MRCSSGAGMASGSAKTKCLLSTVGDFFFSSRVWRTFGRIFEHFDCLNYRRTCYLGWSTVCESKAACCPPAWERGRGVRADGRARRIRSENISDESRMRPIDDGGGGWGGSTCGDRYTPCRGRSSPLQRRGSNMPPRRAWQGSLSGLAGLAGMSERMK